MVYVRTRILPEAFFNQVEKGSQGLFFLRQIMRPQGGKFLSVPDTLEVFETINTGLGIERVSLDIVEKIPGIRARQQVEAPARNMGTQFMGGSACLSGILQPRLDTQLLGC